MQYVKRGGYGKVLSSWCGLLESYNRGPYTIYGITYVYIIKMETNRITMETLGTITSMNWWLFSVQSGAPQQFVELSNAEKHSNRTHPHG